MKGDGYGKEMILHAICETVETFLFLHMCYSAISIFQTTNGEGKLPKLLPAAAPFEYLVHFRPHKFHFVYIPPAAFDAQNKHSLRYGAINELKKANKTRTVSI